MSCHPRRSFRTTVNYSKANRFLANKFVVKTRTFDIHDLLGKIHCIAIENLTNPYWRIKNAPPLAEAYMETNSLNIISTGNYPLYDMTVNQITFTPSVTFPCYSTIPQVNNNIVRSILDKHAHSTIIYTDGSKCKDGTGCAVYISNNNISYKYRLPDHCSIYTAELCAVEKALRWILQNSVENSIILSDSKSVLESLTHHIIKKYNQPLLCTVKKIISELSEKQWQVSLMWVKGHAGVKGNEIVDALARQATTLNETLKISSMRDILSEIKDISRAEWEKMWQQFVRNSKNHYTLIHNSLPKIVPHIQEYSVTRFYSTSLTRMRLNHGKFPAHLCKIGLRENSFCDCDNSSVGDLNHMIFSCYKNDQATKKLFTTLINRGISLPLNLTCLLYLNDKIVNDALVQFVNDAKISI